MNTKIFLYPFQHLQCIPTSYIEGKQKYLFFVLEYSIKFGKKIPVTYLLVPDDNSVFVNYLKKDGIDIDDAKAEEQLNNCFSTNLDNLKFKPDFIVGKTAYQGKCFLIKNNNEVKKVEKRNKTPLTPITFQVNKLTKVRLDKLFPEADYKSSASYAYELEIEPLSLGIEGMPPITRIVFVLFKKYATDKKGAMENFQQKYEKLISNNAGKKLTLEVKRWEFTNQNGQYNTLEFQNDEQFSQITEVKEEKEPKPQGENFNQSHSGNQKPQVENNQGTSNKVIWIVIAVLGIEGFLYF